ncbi:MAG: hypothetical protein PW792_05180 [Acidobacteriaceae bacterium]|nr:hypothetical protein [Acidobacteriaceae bacterium]
MTSATPPTARKLTRREKAEAARKPLDIEEYANASAMGGIKEAIEFFTAPDCMEEIRKWGEENSLNSKKNVEARLRLREEAIRRRAKTE